MLLSNTSIVIKHLLKKRFILTNILFKIKNRLRVYLYYYNLDREKSKYCIL